MHEELLKIHKEHKLIRTKTTWKQKRGEDIDTYWYDELNQNEDLVAQYIVYDITSMHPPFERSITFEKIEIKNT